MALVGSISGSTGTATVIGDITVDGGDVTTTAATFNLLTNVTSQLNIGGVTPTIEIGTYGGSSSSRFAYGQTASPAVKTVEIGTRGNSGSTTNISIGSATAGALGRITLNHDAFLATGNIVGAPGSGANVMTLISSGNIIAKLDTDASADGHKFAVQDWRNIDQFSVGENGNAEISGSLVVSGSTNIGSTVERMSHFQTTGSVIAFDTTFNTIFYVNNPNADITANFTNVPTSNNRIITPTVILSQSATARTITAIQVDGAGVTPINWANGVTPTATANKQNVFGFSLIRSGSIWTALGQMSTYG